VRNERRKEKILFQIKYLMTIATTTEKKRFCEVGFSSKKKRKEKRRE